MVAAIDVQFNIAIHEHGPQGFLTSDIIVGVGVIQIRS